MKQDIRFVSLHPAPSLQALLITPLSYEQPSTGHSNSVMLMRGLSGYETRHLSVRTDSQPAINFYERMVLDLVGETSWGKDQIAGLLYKKSVSAVA